MASAPVPPTWTRPGWARCSACRPACTSTACWPSATSIRRGRAFPRAWRAAAARSTSSPTTNTGECDGADTRTAAADQRGLQQPRRGSHHGVLRRGLHVSDGPRPRARRPARARQGRRAQGAGRSLQGHPRHALGPRGPGHRGLPCRHRLDGHRQGRRRRGAQLPRLRHLRVSRRQDPEQGHVLEAGGEEGPALVPQPPVAKKIPKTDVVHGDVRQDEYFWLRDKDSPETIVYLTAENAYAETTMASTTAFQDSLYREMLARIKEDDQSVPYPFGPWLYYSRTETGKQYAIHC